jgi:hypothetical protein
MSDSDQKLKDEFLKYVEDQKEEIDFDTDEGKDIVYDICLRHKALPVGKRNWNELAGLLALGEDRGGEWLRCWMKQRQRENGALPRNPRVAIPSEISNNPDTHTDATKEDMQKERESLYIERQKTRDVWNAFRRSLRSETRLETFKELIQECANDMAALPKVEYAGSRDDRNAEAILMLSDFHIGDQIDNFYNKYNSEIAMKRLSKVVEDTIDYCQREKVFRLNIVGLGDFLNGVIHTSARLEQEENVTKQVMIASEMLAKAITELQKAAPEVVYRSCVDNHGRIMADIHQNIEEENFSKIIDFYLEARLQGTKVVIAKDNLDDDIGQIDLANGKKVIFVHGHRDSPERIFQNMVGATHMYVDYCLMGHFHSPAYREENGCRIITNGCLCGTEQYAMSKRYFGKASQTLLVFDGDNLIEHIIECDLK